jgi:hypothetical protein
MRVPKLLAMGILVLATARTAFAQEGSNGATPPTADELMAGGVALRKRGEDAEALAVFERAYRLHPSARAAAQIALAQQALGHWREAERGLFEALRGSADDADNQWIARNRTYLEESLAAVQSRLAWLDVDSNTPGAEIWIAGELYGRVPLGGPLRVVAGDTTVEARAAGSATVRQTLQVAPGSQSRVALMFSSDSAENERTTRGFDMKPAPTPAPPSSSRRTAGWITLAGSGGLLLVGVAGSVTREWEAQIYNDDRQCGPLVGQTRYDRCKANRDIGSAAQTVAIGAYAGAAVLGAVAGVLLLGGSRGPSAPASEYVGCTLAGSGLECKGAF